VLQELASNERIVQWVNMMVNYHRKKTEEKALLDLCLQSIYIVLFPGDNFQSGLTKTLLEIQKHVTD
jgi:hypothetical protein